MISNIKFIRKDTKKITLQNFIEGGENYYIVLGKPSKAEQAVAISNIDVEYKDNQFVPKSTNPSGMLEASYVSIAIHIVETNLTDKYEELENRIQLVKELDKNSPELVSYLEDVIAELGLQEDRKNTKKIKPI